MSGQDDLTLLFGLDPAPPQGPGLEADLQVPITDLKVPITVEFARDHELKFLNYAEMRAAAKCQRPRDLPPRTPERPIHYWVQHKPDLADWQLIEYGAAGEVIRGHYKNAVLAYDALLEARARVKPKRPPPAKPLRLPSPPWRCVCGLTFDSAEAILAHSHPRKTKESQCLTTGSAEPSGQSPSPTTESESSVPATLSRVPTGS